MKLKNAANLVRAIAPAEKSLNLLKSTYVVGGERLLLEAGDYKQKHSPIAIEAVLLAHLSKSLTGGQQQSRVRDQK
ncbi:hypothetical protein [Microcoleus sp. bin38.metabat.b11b12b14.051]|uniref:hypothetical protein n=1 Tax=Microcoleus sp. bin38.metabat.b11b12b14.051 TaxID=2742709 RepID=UPI0025E5682A|nr:hypothetical protein [Microcoleus sp. bin38.metabat.b11b12b14.051]